MAMVPADMWEMRQRMPGLIPTARVWMMSWLKGKAIPKDDPIVERRIQVSQMALDLARQLRLNDRSVNREVLDQLRNLLDADSLEYEWANPVVSKKS